VLLETLILHGHVITFNICSLPSWSAMSYMLYVADVLRILKGLAFNNDSGYLQSVQLPLSPYSKWLSWGLTVLVTVPCVSWIGWKSDPPHVSSLPSESSCALLQTLKSVATHRVKRTCYNWIVSLDLHLHFHH